MQARRANPTDDIISVLVHAQIDGDSLTDEETFSGFVLLMAAGNDSTKVTYTSTMRALMENADQREMLVVDLALVPAAGEEALRMFPAFAHFRRTATKDVELNGAQIKVDDEIALWYRRPPATRTATKIPTSSTCTATRAPGIRCRRPALLPRHRAGAPRAEILVEEIVKCFPQMPSAVSRPTSSRSSSAS